MLAEILAAAIGHNPNGAISQVPKQGRKRFFKTKNYRALIGSFNQLYILIGAGLRRNDCAIKHRIEGPLHVSRAHDLAVVKTHSRAEMKDVSQGIRNLPAFGERR